MLKLDDIFFSLLDGRCTAPLSLPPLDFAPHFINAAFRFGDSLAQFACSNLVARFIYKLQPTCLSNSVLFAALFTAVAPPAEATGPACLVEVTHFKERNVRVLYEYEK